MNNSKALTKQILISMEEEIASFVESESKISSSIDYEDQVLKLAHKFAANLIQHSQGKLPKSRNTKKSVD